MAGTVVQCVPTLYVCVVYTTRIRPGQALLSPNKMHFRYTAAVIRALL